MAGRSEDPNKLVTVACKIPTSIRDKFAGIALIRGDIKVAKRLERLILADVRENAPRPFSSILEEEASITQDSTQTGF